MIKDYDKNKDYCTGFPDTYLGVSIKECCRQSMMKH